MKHQFLLLGSLNVSDKSFAVNRVHYYMVVVYLKLTCTLERILNVSSTLLAG